MSLNKALPRLFLIVAALAIAQIVVEMRSMPPVLATKFDFEGAPLAWMTAGAVSVLEFALLALFVGGFWLLPELFEHRPTTTWRMRNNPYWPAPVRRGATLEAPPARVRRSTGAVLHA